MGMSPEEEIFALYTDDEPRRQNVTDDRNRQTVGAFSGGPPLLRQCTFGEEHDCPD
jgi:hypothetical protein